MANTSHGSPQPRHTRLPAPAAPPRPAPGSRLPQERHARRVSRDSCTSPGLALRGIHPSPKAGVCTRLPRARCPPGLQPLQPGCRPDSPNRRTSEISKGQHCTRAAGRPAAENRGCGEGAVRRPGCSAVTTCAFLRHLHMLSYRRSRDPEAGTTRGDMPSPPGGEVGVTFVTDWHWGRGGLPCSSGPRTLGPGLP